MPRETGPFRTTTARSGGIVVGGGAVGMIVIWAANEFFGVTMPPEVGAAVGSICSWLVDIINPRS